MTKRPHCLREIPDDNDSSRPSCGSPLKSAVTLTLLASALVALIFQRMIIFFPITTELSAWYATSYLLDLLVLVALTAFGFYASLGGQPLIRGRLLED